MQFEALNSIVELFGSGRKHAAKAAWNDLDDTFRKKVIEYVAFLWEQSSDEILQCPDIMFETRFGECALSPAVVTTWMTMIPELING